jgi:hypothetical protein
MYGLSGNTVSFGNVIDSVEMEIWRLDHGLHGRLR